MNFIQQVINWLRDGYPQGIPQQDYIALFGVLHHNLTEEEVTRVAKALREGEGGLDADIPVERIQELIRKEVHQHPSEEDVRRVAAHLALGGWPLGSRGEVEA